MTGTFSPMWISEGTLGGDVGLGTILCCVASACTLQKSDGDPKITWEPIPKSFQSTLWGGLATFPLTTEDIPSKSDQSATGSWAPHCALMSEAPLSPGSTSHRDAPVSLGVWTGREKVQELLVESLRSELLLSQLFTLSPYSALFLWPFMEPPCRQWWSLLIDTGLTKISFLPSGS